MPTPADSDSPLLLLVDDDDDIREVAATALELVDGFRIVTATGGLQAVRQAQEHHPDGIVLDVMMPGMDGLQTVERLRADPVTAEIPVILLTARLDGDEPDDGIAGVIAKPFDPMSLGGQIRRLMGWAS
ncbi:MAG: response regulator [Micropruina sp.]|uniref:response regulator n=1 Tax=Micropruina sp. TaxID=2737536 RepID=UPI0039E5E3EB